MTDGDMMWMFLGLAGLLYILAQWGSSGHTGHKSPATKPPSRPPSKPLPPVLVGNLPPPKPGRSCRRLRPGEKPDGFKYISGHMPDGSWTPMVCPPADWEGEL